MTSVSRQKIAEDLRSLGLKAGDSVLLHSSLASIGQVAGGAPAVVQAFLDVLGPRGTLLVPTFGAFGAIMEAVKNWPGAVASIHPLASVAAVGAQAEALCREHWKADLAHGPDTPYVRLAELGGYVCLLGVDQDRNTTLHTVEELLHLPYLQTTAEKTFDTPEGPVTRAWPFFPGPHRDFIGLDAALRRSGRLKTGRVGNAVTRLIKSQDLIDIGLELARQDPAFALCDNPHCAACMRQRADLRRARLAQETFRLSVSSTLAGRYTEEMIEQCQAAGVDAVELDSCRGRPVETAPADDVRRTVGELRAGGLNVTGLRVCSLASRVHHVLELAQTCEVSRVVLPLSPDAAAYAGQAAARRLGVSFYNQGLDSATVYALLAAARDAGAPVGLTFNPANFARAGERPFLDSYRKKLRRFIDQLDLADGLFDGTPQPLGTGHGEIRELLSILRCGHFSWTIVLGAGNRAVGDFLDTARRFMALLERV